MKLLTGDQALLDYNILHLLDKSLAYKKGWLARVRAARQRAQRIAEHNKKLILQTKEASQIYQWCKYHKDTPAYKKRKRTHNQEVEDKNQDLHSAELIYVRDQDYLTHSVQEQTLERADMEPREHKPPLNITSDESETINATAANPTTAATPDTPPAQSPASGSRSGGGGPAKSGPGSSSGRFTCQASVQRFIYSSSSKFFSIHCACFSFKAAKAGTHIRSATSSVIFNRCI
jgi:hypothetical protein